MRRGGMPNLPPNVFKGGAGTSRPAQPLAPMGAQRGPKSPNQTKTKVVSPLAPMGSSNGKRQPTQNMMKVSKPILEGSGFAKKQPKTSGIPRGMGGMKKDTPPKKGAARSKGDSATGMAAAGAAYIQPKASRKQGIKQPTYSM